MVCVRLWLTKATRSVQIYKTEGAAPELVEVRGGFAEVGEKGLTVLAEHVEG